MKEFKVGDEFRTNPMSLEPGGATIKIYYANPAEVRTYDKIKRPKWYIISLKKSEDFNRIRRVDVNGEIFWSSKNGEIMPL